MHRTNNLIYFNNNRSTVADPAVAAVMSALEKESRINAAEICEAALEQVAGLIACNSGELAFTNGTSESIATGIQLLYNGLKGKGDHVITSPAEHPAVLDACRRLEREGTEISYLAHDREGMIDLHELSSLIKPTTVMVCLMAANNETGVLSPVEKIAQVCRDNNIVFFSDTSQYVGKEYCDVNELSIDCMAFGSHKMYGPGGIGALFLSERIREVNPFLRHGFERLRSGFPGDKEHALLAAGFGKAAEIAKRDYWEVSAHVSKLRSYFEHQLLDLEGLRINGSTRYRLYNTSNLTFPNADKVLGLLKEFDFAHNHKSASHVLRAMGLSEDDNRNTFRFSFGKYNTAAEVKLLLKAIIGL